MLVDKKKKKKKKKKITFISSVDTECCPEDLPRVMVDREEWGESQSNPCH